MKAQGGESRHCNARYDTNEPYDYKPVNLASVGEAQFVIVIEVLEFLIEAIQLKLHAICLKINTQIRLRGCICFRR